MNKHWILNIKTIIECNFLGENFCKEFNPSESKIFKNLFPNHSESVQTNTKNVLNVVRRKSVENQSDSFPFNPNKSKSNFQNESIRILINSDWKLGSNSYGLNRFELNDIKKVCRIGSEWFEIALIFSDWIPIRNFPQSCT